ncbi:MAG: peptide deformylase [Bacteroidetes bacterium GWE2_29_8]|nr:MAG: peptide deformylase [Bacteroidetes bacterium GWE2_29_8]OFY15750.1 MAG: peptide deformylase [Bacteroidetes bacterium GWF2_29_10]
MILPIVAYGNAVLREKGKLINKDYPKLKELIDNMFETMYNSSGVGLASNQIGLAIRLFVIDANPYLEDDPNCKDFKKVFINAEILESSGEAVRFSEGCLSFPKIREEITRKSDIKIKYFDENFVEHVENYEGVISRIIQHEYDHIEGKLMVDYLSSLKKRILKRKLENIIQGKVDVDYKIKFNK